MGGESFSAIKNNQENYCKYAEQLLKDRPVDLSGELECGHGRREVRDITVAAVDTEVSPFPHIAQVIKCTRIYRSTKKDAEPEMAVRLFGTSIEFGAKTAVQLARIIREHWSVENLNHPPTPRLRRTGLEARRQLLARRPGTQKRPAGSQKPSPDEERLARRDPL